MASIKRHTISEPFLKIKCLLGEGPHYNEQTKEFRFLDIDGHKTHFIDATKGISSLRTIEHPDFKVSVTADIEGTDDEFVFAATTFFGVMNRHTGKHRVLKHFWPGDPEADAKSKRCRMNDGNVDPSGRLWAGTMVDPEVDPKNWLQPSPNPNAVFRLDSDLSVRKVITDCVVPNGISWPHDTKTMYWTDTPRAIFKYDYDGATGNISNRHQFYKFIPEEGQRGGPDGHVMDEHEHLWVAICGVGKVVRINPQGEITEEISLPTASWVTCPCFVGTELWITSIGAGTDRGDDGGSLFKVDVGVRGRQKYRFKLNK